MKLVPVVLLPLIPSLRPLEKSKSLKEKVKYCLADLFHNIRQKISAENTFLKGWEEGPPNSASLFWSNKTIFSIVGEIFQGQSGRLSTRGGRSPTAPVH